MIILMMDILIMLMMVIWWSVQNWIFTSTSSLSFFCHVDKNHIHVSVVCDVNKNPYFRFSRWATWPPVCNINRNTITNKNTNIDTNIYRNAIFPFQSVCNKNRNTIINENTNIYTNTIFMFQSVGNLTTSVGNTVHLPCRWKYF